MSLPEPVPGAAPAGEAPLDWLAALAEPAWLVDAHSFTVQQANAAAALWLGQAPAALAGRAAEELLPNLEDAVFWADIRAGRSGRLHSDTELMRADGELAQISRRIVPLGEPARCYLVTLRDRSRDTRLAQERETLLAELRATLEATADGILVVDTAGRIRAFNRRFAAMWDLPAAVLAEQDDPAVLDWMRQSVLQPSDYQRRLDEIAGQLLLSATDTVPLLNGQLLQRHTQPQWSAGRPIGRVYSFRPLGRARAALTREEEAAQVGQVLGQDELTGWPNRSAFLACLEEALFRARTQGQSLSVLCVEFDRQALFEVDGRGRARAMGELVEGLRAHLTATERVARLGAARFAVLLPDAGEARAAQLLRRLLDTSRRAAQGLLATAGLPLQIGMALYPQAGMSADDLLQAAECSLHRSQAQASAAAEDPLAWLELHQLTAQPLPDGRRQQRLERAVHEGLAHPAFRLHYQPRVGSHTGEVQAVEAFIRWQDPEDGLLLPALFLPLAERAGLMGALDDWAMENALRQAAGWRAAGWSQALSVNVSAQALCQPAYARRVSALLEATGWPARLLELDVQESALQRDPETALYNLRAVQRLGVRLVLDGWGSGECALAQLRRYPFHAVKLDRSLIRQVPRHAADSAMLQGLVALARALGLQVMAVGVEHASQRQFLADAGCDGWQGLLASAALEARACERGVLARAGALAQRLHPAGRAANE